MHRRTRISLFVVPTALALIATLAFSSACVSDPVPDAEIDSLGPDTTDPGPDHRPGQPCVVCHSSGGPASDDPFAVGGTVFHDPASAQGVTGVSVLFVDSINSSPRNPVLTTASGNFFVRQSDWSPSFPFFVNIFNPADGTTGIMQSHVGRQPSCAGCHRDSFTPAEALYSVGHIYLYHAALVAPTEAGATDSGPSDAAAIVDAGGG